MVLAEGPRKEYQLTVSQNSDATTLSLKLVEYKDGRKSIEGKGTFSAFDPPTGYQYVVNTRTREVTVTRSNPIVYDNTFDFEHLSGMSGDLSKTGEFYSTVTGGSTRISDEYGWFWGSVSSRKTLIEMDRLNGNQRGPSYTQSHVARRARAMWLEGVLAAYPGDHRVAASDSCTRI